MNDSTLALAQRGDREARAALLRELQDPWFRFCLGLLRDPESARDATQETALRFLRLLPSFRGRSQLRTWSLGIALNVVREMRRRRSADELDEKVDPPQDWAPGPDAAAEEAERRQALLESLESLPDRQREVIVLRYFEELSTEQTASVMRCAAGTVKATLHQALRRLREGLRQLVL